MHGHLADLTRRAFAALVVDHRHKMARVGAAHAARPRRPQGLAVADDVVHLGLAEHLVDRHAQRIAAPGEHRVAHRLARAHQRAQLQAVALRPGLGLHHGLERGREQEGVGDAVGRHQFEGLGRREAPLPGDDGAAEVERGQQRVHQAAGPGPVGRAPEHSVARPARVERVEAEPVLARDKAAQVADECALRDQCALGVAGGAAGVDQDGRVSRLGRHGLEARRLGLDGLHPGQFVAVHRAFTDDEEAAQRRATRLDLAQRRQCLAGGDGEHGTAVLQPELQRLGAEQHRQRHGHRADLLDGDVGHGRLEALRQHDGHAVAAAHPLGQQRVRQPVGRALQLRIAVLRAAAALAVEVDRRGLGRGARPAAAAGLGDVEVVRHLPAEGGVQLRVKVCRHRGPGTVN
mmetsp:Transcript_53761/g.126787  ORF Transcript_53761/g.126787 Transcript_53761/m.126787 type:complete len:404 (-) Transcript_53761:79-1290(-)